MAIFSLLTHFRASANTFLSQFEPLTVVIAPILSLLIAGFLQSLLSIVQENGLKSCLIASFMYLIKLIPGVKSYVDAEKQKVVDKMQAGNKSKRDNWRTELPATGFGSRVIEMMKEEKQKDAAWQGKCSGTVYIGGTEADGHFSLINEACSMFAHTNPLHLDVFQSVVHYEAEVVAMTAAMLGSKDKASGGQICGNMTSGGTESILLAVKSSRDYMRTKKGIKKPEMIIPVSAHSAYDKAAQYFNIKLWRVPVNNEYQADVKAIRRYINKHTILIVGSAPGFPHGIIDPIEELGKLAMSFGVCFHVDLCLGGFVLPFARKLGYPIPPFDFSVQGVTSISIDVHKYGLAPKGTSTVLYRNHEIRKHQFVAVTEWSGGLYVSPTIAGSRPGGLIAGAWAAMMSLGEEGYLENTRQIMDVSKKIQEGIKSIPELYVVGRPDMTIVAFASNDIDIFEVNDLMSSKGWHLNALQRPNSLHICLTLQHVLVADDFLTDLQKSVRTVKENPGPISGGLAPIYGAAGRMPDRGMVQELLVNFMDSSC
ncbi:sphingosine-1-phosphate lyase-like [Chenopodium quinoa]|uniref:sphingosine-1-phosphate lyase-like n=1 Tax=Chenopodium quinoa TaxID=63459 RepID=UPI000B77D1CA|nr:sphingosine-1-phosphate lyase-like [Chenopodium quinoa]